MTASGQSYSVCLCTEDHFLHSALALFNTFIFCWWFVVICSWQWCCHLLQMENALCLLLEGLEAKLLCSKYLMEASWSSHWVSHKKSAFKKTCQAFQAHAQTHNVETELHCKNDSCTIASWLLCCQCYKYLLYQSVLSLSNQRQIASWLLWEEGITNKSSKFRMDLWCTSSQVIFHWNISMKKKTTFAIVVQKISSELSSIHLPDNWCFLQIAVDCIEVIFIRGRSLMYFKVFLVEGIPTGTIIVTIGEGSS